MIEPPIHYELVLDREETIKKGDIFFDTANNRWCGLIDSVGLCRIKDTGWEYVARIKKDYMPPTTLTKEQLKHAFETVPEGCVVIMEPETVLKEGDYYNINYTGWCRAYGLVGRVIKEYNINLAARPITPAPPKGYYLIYNQEEIIRKGDVFLFLSSSGNRWTEIECSIGKTIHNALTETNFLLRPANFSDLEYDAITNTFESPSQPAKETVIEPIQFSIEHL